MEPQQPKQQSRNLTARSSCKGTEFRRALVTVTQKPKTTRVVQRPLPRPSLIRRIFTPVRLAILLILLLIVGSVFAFFYAKYARMIDARLRGDIVVRTTGIYAAPRSIRVSQAMTLASLKSYLDGIGYVESSKDADASRGRYLIKGNTTD